MNWDQKKKEKKRSYIRSIIVLKVYEIPEENILWNRCSSIIPSLTVQEAENVPVRRMNIFCCVRCFDPIDQQILWQKFPLRNRKGIIESIKMHLCLMQLQYPFHSLFVVNEKIACLPVFKIMWSHWFFRHFIHLICTFNLLLLIQVQIPVTKKNSPETSLPYTKTKSLFSWNTERSLWNF